MKFKIPIARTWHELHLYALRSEDPPHLKNRVLRKKKLKNNEILCFMHQYMSFSRLAQLAIFQYNFFDIEFMNNICEQISIKYVVGWMFCRAFSCDISINAL